IVFFHEVRNMSQPPLEQETCCIPSSAHSERGAEHGLSTAPSCALGFLVYFRTKSPMSTVTVSGAGLSAGVSQKLLPSPPARTPNAERSMDFPPHRAAPSVSFFTSERNRPCRR